MARDQASSEIPGLPQMAMNSVKSLYMIMKVAEVCNIGCKYCYFFFQGDDSYKDRPAHVSQQHIDATVAFLRRGIIELGVEELGISLHGGEPLMLGKRRFRAMCRSLKAGLDDIVKLQIDMQTNGILIDDEWIDLIAEFDIGVGVSIDGPSHIHDDQRIDKAGRGTHASVIAGFERLRLAACEERIRPPAVISVLSETPDADELFEYFFDDLAVDAVHFLPPMMDWDDYSLESALQVAAFYDQILKRWLDRGDPSISIQWIRDMFASFLSPDDAQAIRRRDDAVFTVRSDGGLGQIDGLAPKHGRFRDTGFCVQEDTLSAFLNSDVSREGASCGRFARRRIAARARGPACVAAVAIPMNDTAKARGCSARPSIAMRGCASAKDSTTMRAAFFHRSSWTPGWNVDAG